MADDKKKTAPRKASSKRAPAPSKQPTATAPPSQPQPPSPSTTDESVQPPAVPRIPVVGLCASAGGLNAFKKFLSHLPNDSGMAYVLIPHLDPDHPSLLVELLSKYTSVPISEASEGIAVAANHIYVLPQDKYMTISGGKLHLSGPVDRKAAQTSMDLFLRSLADDQQDCAICVILSGTGAHGTLGFQAVKANGGMAMAQDPTTAEFDGMPTSAIATGLADYVLAPEEMPAALIGYVQHFHISGPKPEDAPKETPQDITKILVLLRAKTKYDFRCYRSRMLIRRIERRMGLNHIVQMSDYLALLRDDPEEIKRLAHDLLISVTSFFRDPEAYHVIQTQVVPQILQAKDGDGSVRVWVAGCATGEEAYSIAMIFLEQIAELDRDCRLQVFATDVDEDALEVARKGVYPEIISVDVSEDRRRRFFTRTDDGSFRVNKRLREVVTFASQNLISDAPFSRLDLTTCRNVLIYLEPFVQKKVISLLHYSLSPGGYMFLGSAETIGVQVDLFEPVSNKWRVYRRLGLSRPERVQFPISGGGELRSAGGRHAEPSHDRLQGLAKLTAELLLEGYAPAAVLINRKYEVLYFYGPTASFLDLPTGTPTQDLMRMAPHGLRTKLRAAIHKAIQGPEPEVVADATFKRHGASQRVRISVKQIESHKAVDGLLLVTFQQLPDPASAQTAESPAHDEMSKAEQALVGQLEYELASVREDLQSTIEDFETSNEQLKASNEEVMSMNEEFQSANEELETSKEELQSVNEELNTVNSQLQYKLEELEHTNNDLSNLLSSTSLATIFLDSKLNIKLFTPATSKLLNLLPSDMGRPLSDITPKFTDRTLLSDCEKVVQTQIPQEKEVQTTEGQWALRRALPYRTTDNRIDGVVITFADVTQLKLASEQMRRLATVVVDSNDAVCLQDLEGHIVAWNHGAQHIYGFSEAEALGMKVTDRIPEEHRQEEAARLARLLRGEVLPPRETQRLHKDGHLIDVLMTATLLRDLADHPCAIATTERDITQQRQLHRDLERSIQERANQLTRMNQILQYEGAERQRAEQALHETTDRLRAIINTAAEGILTFTDQEVVDTYNKAAEAMFGYPAAEVIGRNVKMLFPDPFPETDAGAVANHLKPHAARIIGVGREVLGRRKNGSTFPMQVSLSELHDGSQLVFTALIRDNTAHRALEKEVLEVAAQEQTRIGQDLHDSVGQDLTGLGLTAQSLVDSLPKSDKTSRQLASRLADGIRKTLRQVRMLSRGLIPVEGEADGLEKALDDLTAQVREHSGIACRLDCHPPVLIRDTSVATQLFRIAQEAITNALKHSHCHHIEVRLKWDGGHVILAIEDDGIGIQETPERTRGIGLRIMRYRAGLIHAILTISAVDGKGTIVTCRWSDGGQS